MRDRTLQFLSPLLLLLLWEALVVTGILDRRFFPAPSEIAAAFVNNAPTVWPHLLVTLQQLVIGYSIGAIIGIVLAAVVTQFPLSEKIITPYILILVTTPMLALLCTGVFSSK